MSDATDQTLAEAFDLIEADSLAEAEALLKPVLEQDENNVDAWWLYAHAVSDPETARMALSQVLRLDATYDEARDMLAELDVHYPVGTQAAPIPPPSSLPEIDTPVGEMISEAEETDFDELEDDETLFSLEDDEPVFGDREAAAASKENAGGRSPIPVIILLIILVLIVIIVVLINPFSSGITPTATSVAQQSATDIPATEVIAAASSTVGQQAATEGFTDTPDAEPTTAVPATATPVEIEPAGDDITDVVSSALVDFALAPDSIGTVQTTLGTTLVAGVCSSSNRAQLQESLDGSLVALASIAETAADENQAIGIALIDCDNENEVLRVIGVSVDDAVDFAADSLDETDFKAKWQAIA